MNRERFQEEHLISGDSADDTRLLRAMATEARQYLQSFRWSPPVDHLFLTFGIGGVVAVFYVEFSRPIDGGDKALWVVVGDLPSAYLVTDEIASPRMALETYCGLMDEWISAVLGSKALDDVFPVGVPPARENAERLASRTQFLRGKVIPKVPD